MPPDKAPASELPFASVPLACLLLNGKKVAILVANFFEQVELAKPRAALEEAGASVTIVSPDSGQIQGMNHADKGGKFDVATFSSRTRVPASLTRS